MEKQAWEKLIQKLIAQRILQSSAVIRSLRRVAREPFLPENVKSYGAVDSPLPIGLGQTASAPLS